METILSEQANSIMEALKCLPPDYVAAESVFGKYKPTLDELGKIATELMEGVIPRYTDETESEKLKKLIDENDSLAYIYKTMQYLLEKGLNPNILVDDNCDNVMFSIALIESTELAPKLMRLFMENGGDPNLYIPDLGESLFDNVHFMVVYDEYFNRGAVYCWLVLMAYGGRCTRNNWLPVNMEPDYDVSVFKNYELYDYYEIKRTKENGSWYGCWQMHIYETFGNSRKKVASYGDLGGELICDYKCQYKKYMDFKNHEQHEKTNSINLLQDTEVTGTPIQEDAFLKKIGKAYESYAVGDIDKYMIDNFHYSSIWVLAEITSAKEYVDYLSGKVKTLKEHNVIMETELMKLKGTSKPCLFMCEKGKSKEDGVILTVERTERGTIRRMDMMAPGFYSFEPVADHSEGCLR